MAKRILMVSMRSSAMSGVSSHIYAHAFHQVTASESITSAFWVQAEGKVADVHFLVLTGATPAKSRQVQHCTALPSLGLFFAETVFTTQPTCKLSAELHPVRLGPAAHLVRCSFLQPLIKRFNDANGLVTVFLISSRAGALPTLEQARWHAVPIQN